MNFSDYFYEMERYYDGLHVMASYCWRDKRKHRDSRAHHDVMCVCCYNALIMSVLQKMKNCVQSKLSVRTVINSPGDRGVKEGMFISYCQLTTMNRNTGAKQRHNVCTCITAYICVLILLCFWACVRACFQLSVGCQNSLNHYSLLF